MKLILSPEKCFKKIQSHFEKKSIQIGEKKNINHGIQFRVAIDGYSGRLRIYHSKKKGTNIDYSPLQPTLFREKIINLVNECFGLPKNEMAKSTNQIIPKSLIGTDESGKGDYFGPLVIAGVFVEKNNEKELADIGVQDSKNLSDAKCQTLAAQIKKYPYSVVTIGPEKYNDLYDKIKNLNKLLAWGHARVIENILENVECHHVLSDQFGDESLIKKALMEKGNKVHLEQRPRAEENIVVAAASILARDGFLEYMNRLSREYQIPFVKGASQKVIDLGKTLVTQNGKDILKKVAKLHFRTTQNILSKL